MRPHLKPTRLMLALLVLLLLFPAARAEQAGSVTGILFHDRDLDGLVGDREGGIAGAELQLVLKQGGAESAVVTRTDGEGRFSFHGLASGDYYLKALLPGGYVPGPYHQKGSQLIPSSSATSLTPAFYLAAGETKGGMLLGAITEKQGSFVRATAFGDSDLNGGRFSNEPFLRGVQLELLFELGGVQYLVGSASTDREGVGTIDNVAPGQYILAATLPGSYVVGPLGKKINPFYNTILPSDSNYGQSAPFYLPARGSIGMGVGGAVTGSGTGRVWLDSNLDGRMDEGEGGAKGIQITLEHTTMGVQRSLVTGDDGLFSFSKLQPGNYRLTAVLPDTYMFAEKGGDSLLASDTERTDAATVQVLADKEADFGRIGVIPNTSLEVLAFHDSNVNGMMDEGEPAFAGARLLVLRDGRQLADIQSDADGNALVPLIRGGALELRLSLPDGQIFSVSGGEEGNAFHAARAQNNISVSYDLKPGKASRVYAGVTLPAQITGSLFEDANSNAILDSGESAMPGFVVQVMDEHGQMVEATTTDERGSFVSPPLIPGAYRLRVLLKTPYIFSGQPAQTATRYNRIISQTPDWGESDLIALEGGQTMENMDAALFRSGVIEGKVLLGDHNDQFSGGQGGLAGVLVTLLDEDMKAVSGYTVATTDEEGSFLLKGALPGSYYLSYKLPEGAAFSRPLTEERQLVSAIFDVEASDQLQAPTYFAVKTGSFSGRAYLDMDVNGQYGEGDLPLPGAVIRLNSQIPANSREFTSGEDGSFMADGLRPDGYQLSVSLPEGALISADENSPFSPAISGSAEAAITIGMGEQRRDQAIAAVSRHSLSGRVYFDNNLSRALDDGEPGQGAQEIRLRHQLSQIAFTAVSDGEGNYEVPLLFPGAYSLSLSLPRGHELYAPEGASQQGTQFEQQITLSAAQSASEINLGLVRFGSLSGQMWDLGGGSSDLSGLAIRLRRADEARPPLDTATQSDGSYRFENLYPGEYVLEAQLPEGYRFAREIDSRQKRLSMITSDGSPVNLNQGESNPFTLLMGEDKQGQDIGMGTLGRLGDYAWLDLDGDGMQDAGEPGVPGILISIYQYGELAQQTTTDAWGRYLLRDVYPGTYRLEATLPPELKATRLQNEFPLVASILPEEMGPVISAEGIQVPSGGRNLNADLGLALVKDGQLPASMQQLPQKDWTPLVPVEPKRVR